MLKSPRPHIRTKRTATILVVTACLLSLTLTVGCSSTSSSDASKTLYQRNHDKNLMALNDYDYNHLGDNGGLKYYLKNGAVASKAGIDVSDYQGSIDWNAIKEDGVDFVFLRVGYRGYTQGGLYLDENFAQDAADARAAGLSVGVYFFSQAKSEDEAHVEATFVENALQGVEIDYPVVYDLEPNLTSGSRTASLDYKQATANTLAFCKQIAQASYTPMVYMNRNDALNLFDLAQLQNYSIWYAEYASTPSLDFKFAIWQYTNQGTIDGISGTVDKDIFFTETSLG